MRNRLTSDRPCAAADWRNRSCRRLVGVVELHLTVRGRIAEDGERAREKLARVRPLLLRLALQQRTSWAESAVHQVDARLPARILVADADFDLLAPLSPRPLVRHVGVKERQK